LVLVRTTGKILQWRRQEVSSVSRFVGKRWYMQYDGLVMLLQKSLLNYSVLSFSDCRSASDS